MVNIKIIGTDNRKTSKIESACIDVITSMNVPAQVELIDKVDEILNYKIHKTPSLLIDNKIIFEDQIPAKDILSQLIMKALKKNQKFIENILVPVDFSDTSINALKYALQLAESIKAKITVYHVVRPSYSEVYPVPPVVSVMEQNNYFQLAKERLDKLSAEFNLPYKERIIKNEVELGLVENCITVKAKNIKASMIILGSTGKGGWLNKILGSVSTSVTINATCPVLVIPNHSEYEPYNKIIYTSNNNSASLKQINFIIKWANYFNSELRFIHVSDFAPFDATMKELIFKKIIDKIQHPNKYLFDVITNDNANNGIIEYANKNGINLIVLVNKNRSFYQKFFEKSVTKQMLKNMTFPILVLHN